MIRKHIVFTGWLQGVGFRWRARQAAEVYGSRARTASASSSRTAHGSGCTRWVRNEWDGSVTMEIQGEEEAIDRVIMSIEAGRYVQIENMDCREIPVDPEEYSFRTR